MDTIQIKDKQFTVSIKEQDIQKEVIRVANEINRDLAGKNPLFLSVLNGSFMFTADLLKHITIPCEISFVKLASYQGVTSTGVIKEVIGLNEDIAGRTVVIVEDIVDTGLTMQRLLDTLGTRNPEAIHIASLLVKPEKLKVNLNIEYVAMEIPNDFIVGYGLDYDGFGRNYPDIYTVVEHCNFRCSGFRKRNAERTYCRKVWNQPHLDRRCIACRNQERHGTGQNC